MIAGYLRGRDAPLESALERLGGDAPAELIDALQSMPDDIDEADLQSTGYVVHTLQTALYGAVTASSAEETIISAVNRNGDADTVGAVTGAVAGARFGRAALLDAWFDTIES